MSVDKNNANWGAAAFGSNVGITDNTSNVVDSYDPDQSDDDQLDLDVAVSDSGNDNSTEANGNGNDSSLDLAATDVLNNKSVNTNTDNSVDTDTDVDDSYNTDNSTDTDTETDIDDSFNVDSSVDTDIETDIETDIDDSFNADSSVDTDIDDSYNTSNSDDDTTSTVTDAGNFDLSVAITDSFNAIDDDLIDVDGITGDVSGLQALGGNGNIFGLDQILTMNDNDTLDRPTVTNDGCFDQYSEDVTGGTANTTSGFGNVSGEGDVAAAASSSAGGAANLSAFNQDIAMGANIQYASVDMSVVGGSDGANLAGDDS